MSIFNFNNILLSHLECDEIINLSKSIGFKKSAVIGEDYSSVINNYRTSHSLKFYYGDNASIDAMRERIGNIVGKPAKNIEMEVTIYLTNQYFTSHYDFLPIDGPIYDTGGQRLYSCIVYLNDDFEGGQTQFVDLSHTIQPIKGKAVMWRNYKNIPSELEPLSLHASLSVTKGEKLILIAFIRETEFKKPLQTTN